MKEPNTAPLAIPPDIAAKCDGPHQWENFDRIATAVFTTPKATILKDPPQHKPRRRKHPKK